ncbi:MAG: hemerythrin domain-containing protein [Betaproteobacteria bacterium]|nr:hemerythrin domain-containing protein [Betaproteobacteria bacterium]
METILSALWSEHRSIAAVLHGMLYLVREKCERGKPIETRVLRAMLYYLDVFPERVHHPKEEQFLFKAVRARTSEANPLLDELAREHAEGKEALRRIDQALLRYEEGGEAEFAQFAQALEDFAGGYRDHMRKEEEVVMGAARRALSKDDWSTLQREWALHGDPIAEEAAREGYERLINRIVELAPPPIGLGCGTELALAPKRRPRQPKTN